MIPFLPPQNANALAGLAGPMGGAVPGPRPEAGSPGFAPVFGGAVAGQIIAALPADSLAGASAGPEAAAWSKFAEVVRIASMAGSVQPATLAQLRTTLLSSIEALRQAMAASTLPVDASIPNPQVDAAVAAAVPVPATDAPVVSGESVAPAAPESEPGAPVRRPGDPVGQDVNVVFGVAVPSLAPQAPSVPAAMNANEALAVLERFVARAPLAELPSLARGLRQVMVARPAAQAASLPGEPTAAPLPGQPSQVAEPAPASPKVSAAVPAPVRAESAPESPRAVRSPAAVSLPSAPEPVAAESTATAPAASQAPNSPAVPAPRVSMGAAESAGVPGVAVRVVAGIPPAPVASGPAVFAAPAEAPEAVAFAAVPAANDAGEVPVQLALFKEPEGFPGAAVVSTAPLAEGEDPLAFISLPVPDAEPAVASGQDAGTAIPALDEPEQGEPVAWLARQARGLAGLAETALAETNGRIERVAVPSPAPAANPAAMTAGSAEPVPVPAPVYGSAAEIPAVSITTLDLAADRAIPSTPVRAAAPESAAPADVAPPARAAQPAPAAAVPASPAPQAPVARPEPVRSAPVAARPDAPEAVVAVAGAQPTAAAEAVRPAASAVPSAPLATGGAPATLPQQAPSTPASAGQVAEAASPAVAAPAVPPPVAATAVAPGTEAVSAALPAQEAGTEPVFAPVTAGNGGEAGRPEGSRTDQRQAGEAGSRKQAQAGHGARADVPAGTAEDDGAVPAPERAAAVRRAAEEAVQQTTGMREAVSSARAHATEAAALPTAVQAVLARIADEVAASRPGRIREIELTVNTPELGAVRVRFEAGEEGTVRVVIRTQTEQAAQSLRDGLPTLRSSVETVNTRVSFDVAQAAVGTATDFGGGHAPHPRPEAPVQFQSSAQPAGRDEPEQASRTLDGYPRRRTLVDVLA